MTCNVGTIDRLFRLVVGLVLIALPFVAPGLALWGSAAAFYGVLAVGAVLVLTAAFRFCPLYRVVGVRTCSA